MAEDLPVRSGVGDHCGSRVFYLGLLLDPGLPPHVHGGGTALRHCAGKYLHVVSLPQWGTYPTDVEIKAPLF